jgi:hypothetical protein
MLSMNLLILYIKITCKSTANAYFDFDCLDEEPAELFKTGLKL